ncbi:putative methyltransferase-like protein C27D7.08c [Aspergillus awamori]|uniref:Putative methyltransferase-like protein C27D7.08c n=1 Tax=Aspergillus awamori TaxID=105351 RepID=A0A401KDC1_ASPAW|nr:putative methyltransferase-like protein C27D7.08c [Aspergillus awamori]
MRALRNIYKDEVDFTALALQSPEFAKYLKSNGQLDFSDPDAVRQLTKSLLQRDFELKVEIPENRLCPPVPNRLNYILWLQDLLDTTGDEYRDNYDPDREVIGLDMMLQYLPPARLFYATSLALRRNRYVQHYAVCAFTHTYADIDNDNIRTSRDTVSKNKLDSRIEIIQTDPKDELIPLDTKLNVDRLDFTMCNPPFYASRDELIASAEAKERPPFSACTGAEVEMVTTGGEIAFITRMIEESLRLRERVIWYTTMLGKLSSVSVLIETLLEHKNNNYAVTEFVQGNKTRRWAIAWSWTDLRPTVSIARGTTAIPKHLLPFPSEYIFTTQSESIDEVSAKIDSELSALHVQWLWRKNLATGVGFAMQNVWSRQARRKMQNPDAMAEMGEIDETKAALGFKVQCKKDAIDEKGVRVIVRWLKGRDTVLFESFCGMLKRKVESN